MDIRVLGPVEVRADGVDVRLGGPKQRAVFAVLAADVGRPVSVDALIDTVWAGEPTPGARSTLQTYVSNLRAELGDVIIREAGGYRLDVAPASVDAARFEQAVSRATELVEERPAEAAQQLRAALALWRGRPYADVVDSFRLELEATRLEELRLAAVETRIEAELVLGHHAELVPELEVLCAEFPLREGFRVQHMLALYRSGRQADALRAFQKTRTYLADELGLEPSAQLRDLERRILNQDESLLPEIEPQVETVSFLLMDIEDSTPLWELQTDAMRRAVARHDDIVYGAVEAAGGRVVKRVGDGLDTAFADAGGAVAAAHAIQLALAEEDWPLSQPLRVRMTIDVGEVEARRGDYFGPVLNRAGRLLASAHGGQVLLTGDAHAALAATQVGWQARALGEFRFKGIGGPVTVFQLVLDGLPADFPPLRIDRLPATPAPGAFDRTVRGYELREQVGSGGIGTVYRAYQPSVGREVAVKVIRPELANEPAFIRRFEADAQLVAQLEHPHLVSLHDYWRDPEGAYLVMGWLRGGSLQQALQRGPWSVEPALRLLSQVGGALAYAHRNGAVHGDLKPSNVLLDAEGHAYLSDFGIADGIGAVGDDIQAFGELARALVGADLPAELDRACQRATEAGSLKPLLDAMAAAAGSPAAETLTPAENPYKGLRAFGESDAATFFGRDALVGELLASLGEHRLVAVVGPSGIGKSSVVKAGLIPALRAGGLPGSDRWAITDMFPGSYPFEELAAALVRVAIDEPPALVDELARNELGLRRVAKRILPADTELLLVVDQFEELFTLTADEDARRMFLDGLTALAADGRSAVRVVVTLRADFLDHPLRYAEFGELLRAGLVAVPAPSEEELAEAIERPAAGVGARFEPGLVSRIIRDVHEQPGALPLLQYALTELFAARTSNVLTNSGYARVGGVVGALGRRAEQLHSEVDASGQAAARQVFLRLVAVDPEAQDARRRVRRRDLRRLELDPGAVDEVLRHYGEHRLLTFDREPLTRSPTVEVAHEAILSRWERLRGWIDERREDLLLHRRLAEALAEWEQAGRDPDYLPREGRLAQLEVWAAATDVALTVGEREFLAAARAAADAATRRRARVRRALLAGFAALAAATSVAAVFAFLQRGEARDSARLSLARQLAASARANLEVDPERSILLAIESVDTTRKHDRTVLREAEEALHQALAASRTVLTVRQAGPDAAFSPDGRRFVSIGQAGERSARMAIVWDGRTGGRLLTLRGHEDEVLTARYSPDGRLIATASVDGTARIWDADTGTELRILPSRGAAQGGAAVFNGDGTRLVTVGDDGMARVWDTRSWRKLHELVAWRPPGPDVQRWRWAELAAFDRSGRLFVANPWHAEIRQGDPVGRIWDASGKLVAEIPEADLPVRGVMTDADLSADGRLAAFTQQGASLTLLRLGDRRVLDQTNVGGFLASDVRFSPDGTRLAVSSTNGTAIVWKVTANGLRESLRLVGHTAPISGIDFSADGSKLLTASDDGTARVWDISPTGGREILAAEGFDAPDLRGGVAFSPDSKIFVAASGPNGTVRGWELRTGRQLLEADAHARGSGEATVLGIDFTPDGSKFATASHDGTARIFDAATGEEVAVFRHQCPQKSICWVLDVEFSAGGSRLVTASADFRVRVFDVASRKLLHELRHDSFVWTVELDAASGLIASAGSFDATIGLWDSESGRLVRSLRHEPATDAVADATFSPDGTRLASAGLSGTLRIWNPADGRKLLEVQTTLSQLLGAQFSPDGQTVATASTDAVSLWDATSGEETLRLSDRAWDLAFSPDGTMLAWSSKPPDSVVRVVALELGRLLEIARGRVTRSLTDEECRQYLQGPCPSR